MEAPECPVCLQFYDSATAVPRVLACGHSACEECLRQLPRRHPHTVRCPACNQLVHFPQPQGPSALPKNIDLLRLCLQSSIHKHDPRPSTTPQTQFLPLSWSHHFYSSWKDWVLPNDAVRVAEPGFDEGLCSVLNGTIGSSYSTSNSFPFRFCGTGRGDRVVGLVRVGLSLCLDDGVFDYGYVVRVIECLSGMREAERVQLVLMLRACSRQRRVCGCYGFWYNLNDFCLYLVCERYSGGFIKTLEELGNEVDRHEDWLVEKMSNLVIEDGLQGFAMIGMEICETVIGLHSEGLIAGCLGLDCFGFDDLGHLYVDLNGVLAMGRKVRRCIAEGNYGGQSVDTEIGVIFSKIIKSHVFVSPEVLFELLQNEGVALELGGLKFLPGHGSDTWSLACILLRLLIGQQFTEELVNYICNILPSIREENDSNYMNLHLGWIEKVTSLWESKMGSKYVRLQEVLCKCLILDPKSRPLVIDVWKRIRGLVVKCHSDIFVGPEGTVEKENTGCCIVLGELCRLPKSIVKGVEKLQGNNSQVKDENGEEVDQVEEVNPDRDLFESISMGNIKVADLQGHLDCITGLAVGGGFLFSSSFDKIIHVWSLQDLTLVHSFKGHEHKVVGVVFSDEGQPLCISGDSGGGVFVWGVNIPFGREPIKKWYEQMDWRYTGIHALTVSGTGYLYTGGGDRSIKAWSLQDYTLSCTMDGHKSVVSALSASEGVLYSGSWDGTIRLWSLNDHSPLAVLGEDVPGNVTSVLSLFADQNMLVVAYENGSIKIWRNDMVMKSAQIHNGAILSIGTEGKWLFTGGWDKIVNVQEISGDEFQIDSIPTGSIACDSVITALLSWQGNLFVGFADRLIKAFSPILKRRIPKQ